MGLEAEVIVNQMCRDVDLVALFETLLKLDLSLMYHCDESIDFLVV